MCVTCKYLENMSKMIQIRNVPDDIHSILKERAAKQGITLSDFIKRELKIMAERPSMDEWLESVSRRKPIPTRKTAAQIIRELRDSQ
jgi:plasmid stability protein